jgi:hypothetical protein
MKFLLFIPVVIFASCSVKPSKTLPLVVNTPSCINDKIESFKREPKQNPARSITEYTYKGKKVYYITAPCCDQYSEVFDSNCNLIGHPDGGITGKGDGKLAGFSAEVSDEKLIWKDDR